MLDSIVKVITGKVKLRGATDGTLIGNTGDSLKVTTSGDVVIGSLFSYAGLINMAASTLDNPMLLISNPSNSGKTLIFLRLAVNTTSTNQSTYFNIWANPTVTSNGTSATINRRQVGGTATSVALAYTLPTTSGGLLLAEFYNAINTNTEELILPARTITLLPGNKLLLTGQSSQNNRTAVVTLVWEELSI
jgi:hypothetical protein